MVVIRRGNNDRVDVLLLLEHHAVVLVLDRLGMQLERLASRKSLLGGRAFVAVAQRDDVVALGDVRQVRRTHAVNVADNGDVDRVARRLEPGAAEHVARHDREAGRGGDRSHELAA